MESSSSWLHVKLFLWMFQFYIHFRLEPTKVQHKLRVTGTCEIIRGELGRELRCIEYAHTFVGLSYQL